MNSGCGGVLLSHGRGRDLSLGLERLDELRQQQEDARDLACGPNTGDRCGGCRRGR